MFRKLGLPLSAVVLSLSGCGGGSGGGTTSAPIPTPTPTPTPPSTGSTACVAGSWTVAGTNMPLVKYESSHFVIRYNGSDATLADATDASKFLESVYDFYVKTVGFREPSCGTANKIKINVVADPAEATMYHGGVDDNGLPFIKINPYGLSDHPMLAHELTHVFQAQAVGMRITDLTRWFWESHANWMATQVPGQRDTVNCSADLANYPHLYYGSVRTRYCNWQFWEFLKDRYGYSVINAIWNNPTAPDPFSALLNNQGWTVSQLNDLFGQWAMRNVTWDYINPDGSDQGAIYRASYGGYDLGYDYAERLRRTTSLMPIDAANRRYAVPPMWAPQRWGYNLVRIVPDAGATSITVAFRGVTQSQPATNSLPGLPNEPLMIPAPASGWRWGVVIVDSAGKPRYSTLMGGGDEQLSVDLKSGDQSVYMVVVAAPTQLQQIMDNQPFYSIYRYPWMVQFTNAQPWGYQAGAPDPISGGHRHPNGGGWVSSVAQVDSSAYVGPRAVVVMGQVRGSGRIEDDAVLFGGTVQDNAVLAGLTTLGGQSQISGNARISTTYAPLGLYGNVVTLSGIAQMIGDVAQSDVGTPGAQTFTASRGIYFGLLLTASASDPTKGAGLTSAPVEVTAPPNYIWR